MRQSLSRTLKPTWSPMIALVSAALLVLAGVGTAFAQPGNGQGPREKETICHKPGTPAPGG